jgi:hypothetical protein
MSVMMDGRDIRLVLFEVFGTIALAFALAFVGWMLFG